MTIPVAFTESVGTTVTDILALHATPVTVGNAAQNFNSAQTDPTSAALAYSQAGAGMLGTMQSFLAVMTDTSTVVGKAVAGSGSMLAVGALALDAYKARTELQNGQVSQGTLVSLAADTTALLGIAGAIVTGGTVALGVGIVASAALGIYALAQPNDAQGALSMAVNDLLGQTNTIATQNGSAISSQLQQTGNGNLSTGINNLLNAAPLATTPILDQLTPLLSSLNAMRNGYQDNGTQCITTLQSLFGTAEITRSPLVLDLNGDGVTTLSKSAGVHFDLDGNGFAETTGWVAPTDGLLVWDRNGNGVIDNGTELFGNNTVLASGAKAANGFAALADLDTNHDGVVNSLDANFSNLMVWKDANSNGVTDAGELLTLAQAGVQSINVGYTAQTVTDAQGNQQLQAGQYTGTDGLTHAVNDVWFSTDTARTVELNPVEVSDAIATLPDLQGFGNVHSLHQAMALDTSEYLQGLIQQYATTTDPTARKALVTTIIYAWSGGGNVDPASRSTTVYGNAIGDARVVCSLEAFMGQGYMGVWCWGERNIWLRPHFSYSAFGSNP